MDSCIQNYTVAKRERDFDNTVLSLRLGSAEAARFWRIMDKVKERNPYAGKSDVVRELLGLTAPSALTAEEIAFFRRGKTSNIKPSASKAVLVKNLGELSDESRKQLKKRAK